MIHKSTLEYTVTGNDRRAHQASISVGTVSAAGTSADCGCGAGATASKSTGNLVTLGLSARMLRHNL